jgi:hypothetical protein
MFSGDNLPHKLEICSVFQFVYQGGGNLAEGIAFGRVAGRNAAAERPINTRHALRDMGHARVLERRDD